MDRKLNDQSQSIRRDFGWNRRGNQRGRQNGSGSDRPTTSNRGRGRGRGGSRPVGGAVGGAPSSSGKGSKKSSNEEGLVELFQRLDMNEEGLCLRPSFKSGLKGRKVAIVANFFKMVVENVTAYRYSITFTYSANQQENGRALHKRAKQRALMTFIETAGAELFQPIGNGYGYDSGAILYTYEPLRALPGEGQTFSFQFIEFDGADPKMVDINIQPNGSVLLVPDLELNNHQGQDFLRNPAVLQALDIICKKDAFQNDIVFGSRIFVSELLSRRIRLEIRGNVTTFDLAFGHHQSTRLCQGGLMMNIDRSTAVLYRGGPLIKAMANVLGRDIERSNYRCDERDHRILNELRLLRVEVHYRPYVTRLAISSFTRLGCDRTFFNDGGVKISVFDYFKRQYPDINLKYPHLPCIVYGNRKYIPVELCTLLPDQRKPQKLRDDLLRVVSSHIAEQRPEARAAEIVAKANQLAAQESFGLFNVGLVPEMVTVEARVLDPPALRFGHGPFTPRNGSWQMPRDTQNRQKTFFQPRPLIRWALMILNRQIVGPIQNHFVERLRDIGASLGMQIDQPIRTCTLTSDRVCQKLKDFVDDNLQLIVVIMPKSDVYGTIKSLCEQTLGIPTQFVDARHYDDRKRGPKGQRMFDSAYLTNLLLKINTKLGGVNTKLTAESVSPCSILNDRTMVVGIDVNHPSPGEHSPSIAAVVGSIDKDFVKYRTEIHVNPERLELVPVAQMMRPIIEAYHEAQSVYPNQILVYRDGVGEGYFRRVMDEEIDPLRELLNEFNIPKLTYIIVSKRHNTRFFRKERNKEYVNISPGTVVDTVVCHYKLFDFYLCSQNAFLGTARPGKYTVLWNSGDASADDLQMATYFLCYLFARATVSISDPAPARYAHHAATRGKVYLLQMLRNENAAEALVEQLNRRINVDNSLRDILYFI